MRNKLETQIKQTEQRISMKKSQFIDVEAQLSIAIDPVIIHDLKCDRAKINTKLKYLNILVDAHRNELKKQ